jgi:choline dehydrogenase-like flavoprotein
LNCTILKKLRTPIGGSIHYAGSLPFSNTEELYRLAPNGKLYGTKNIYIADASGFSYLPGKGLTLSLMANAHLVAKNILTNE